MFILKKVHCVDCYWLSIWVCVDCYWLSIWVCVYCYLLSIWVCVYCYLLSIWVCVDFFWLSIWVTSSFITGSFFMVISTVQILHLRNDHVAFKTSLKLCFPLMSRTITYFNVYIILYFLITYRNALVLCQSECACLQKVNTVVFFVKRNDNTYTKGRALMQMYRVVPITNRGNFIRC